ncbi:MAG TPA: hypothetical protein VF450_23570 [Noviherbaspirillum sp.]
MASWQAWNANAARAKARRAERRACVRVWSAMIGAIASLLGEAALLMAGLGVSSHSAW